MGVRSLLSFGLFILPVAITVGVLVGVEQYRLGHNERNPLAPDNDIITTTTYCQRSYGYSPAPGRYTFNPNQWGVTSGPENLNLCMNVTTFNNATYATNDTAPTFTATWQYPQGPEDEPVHAFPNAKLNLTKPLQLSSLTGLQLDVTWTYGAGRGVAAVNDGPGVDNAGMNANVCVDMFFDSIAEKSDSTNASDAEVMIWLGRYGPATLPIGWLEGVRMTKTVNTTNFDLYSGENSLGQKVFTWVAESNTTELTGDIAPLIQDLANVEGPVEADYMGYIAFGTEALASVSDVTLSVPKLRITPSTKE